MTHISELDIPHDSIAIICTGPSSEKIDYWNDIQKNCFTICQNFNHFITPNAMFFCDVDVEYLKSKKRAPLYITRDKNAENYPGMVDYYFDGSSRGEGADLLYNYSLYILLWLMVKFFPHKPKYLFGVDMTDNYRAWRIRGDGTKVFTSDGDETMKNYLERLSLDLTTEVKSRRQDFANVYNCNTESGLECFQKIDYRNVA